MAVKANTYGEVIGVAVLVGDLVDSRTFSSSTIPTDTQVELFLDDTASEINVALDQQGYIIKVVSADFPDAFDWLVSLNEKGAAALVLSTLPAEAYVEPGEEAPAGTRRQYYQREFERGLKRIKDQQLNVGRSNSRLSKVFAGSQEDSSGNKKLPIFTRAGTEYPSTRRLIE